MPQKPAARPQFPVSEILVGLNGGLDGYTDLTMAPWKRWLAALNCFSSMAGNVQRARWANVVVPNTGATQAINTIAFVFNQSQGRVNEAVITVNPHGLLLGQLVTIAGNATGANNGTFPVVAIDSPTQFEVANANAGTGAGGTVAPAYVAQGVPFTTLKFFALPGLSSYLIADANGKLFSFDSGSNYLPYQRVNNVVDPYGTGSSNLAGPWSREALQNILYEMNGTVKQSGRGANAVIVENFGLDAPDVSPQVVLSAGSSQTITNIQRTNGTVTVTLGAALTVPGGNGVGMVNVKVTSGDTSFAGTFVVLTGSGTATLTWAQTGQNTALLTPTGTVDVNITKSVGRSYAYAWENANKPHVGAPSPATQFIQYNAQNGVIQLIEQGTVAFGALSPNTSATVTGTGTTFTSAWVGRYLWATVVGIVGRVTAVTNSTTLTVLAGQTTAAQSGLSFQIFDPQSTHIRLYASADGGATYFRIQRNVFTPSNSALIGSGLQFFDNANSEPPAFPFTTEVSQLNNVPPPVGSFLSEYQGRLVVFGVPGALQSFFYSNLELTSVGLPQESFAPLNQYTMPIQNAKLNGWIELPGSAVFWSDRQDMFRLTGTLTDNTAAAVPTTLGAQITRLPYNLGCASPFAVDITPLGAIWVTPQAEVWLFTDRYAPRNIGRPIQNILNSINISNLNLIRAKYYHNNTRNWFVLAVPANGASANNTLLILDLDLLSSNGSPSFFVFDMATNQPTWYQYQIPSISLETFYEPTALVRLFVGSTDLVEDTDFSNGFGTEVTVPNAGFTTHAWGNDSATILKRPTWFRFNTNRDPSLLVLKRNHVG